MPIPKIEKNKPKIWKRFVFSIFIRDDKIIVTAGIAARTSTAFITWVKFSAKYTTELNVLIVIIHSMVIFQVLRNFVNRR